MHVQRYVADIDTAIYTSIYISVRHLETQIYYIYDVYIHTHVDIHVHKEPTYNICIHKSTHKRIDKRQSLSGAYLRTYENMLLKRHSLCST